MGRYKKKTVYVDAIQFQDDVKTISAISDFFLKTIIVDYSNPADPYLKVGSEQARVGDWIVRARENAYSVMTDVGFKEQYSPD